MCRAFYTVSTELVGFKKFVRDNVQVRVNDLVELNITLAIGDVAESIQVSAETPLLSTAEESLGQVVDERRVLELPIFSGNAMEFTLLAPGTVNGTDMRLRKAPFNNAPSQFSTDGSGLFNNSSTSMALPTRFPTVLTCGLRSLLRSPPSSSSRFRPRRSTQATATLWAQL